MAKPPLRTISDFKTAEIEVLETIRAVPNGERLFLADPFRFLREHGFTVDATFVDRLTKLQPKLASPNTDLYDRIQRGDFKPLGTLHIVSLGLTGVQDPTS
jgi:hypothetical protein